MLFETPSYIPEFTIQRISCCDASSRLTVIDVTVEDLDYSPAMRILDLHSNCYHYWMALDTFNKILMITLENPKTDPRPIPIANDSKSARPNWCSLASHSFPLDLGS